MNKTLVIGALAALGAMAIPAAADAQSATHSRVNRIWILR